MLTTTTFTEPLGQIGKLIAENLGGEIVGLMQVRQYTYQEGESVERHFTVLVRQPLKTHDSRDHWVVHTVGIHSSGHVGIVGSGYYHMEDERAAREHFLERV